MTTSDPFPSGYAPQGYYDPMETEDGTVIDHDDPRQPTCAERLPNELAGRIHDLDAMLSRDDPDEGDDELPPINEYGLGSEVRYSIRVELSTGGPADYVTAIVAGGEVIDATYHFADWFDHAEKRLDGEDLAVVERWLGYLFDLDDMSMYVRD